MWEDVSRGCTDSEGWKNEENQVFSIRFLILIVMMEQNLGTLTHVARTMTTYTSIFHMSAV